MNSTDCYAVTLSFHRPCQLFNLFKLIWIWISSTFSLVFIVNCQNVVLFQIFRVFKQCSSVVNVKLSCNRCNCYLCWFCFCFCHWWMIRWLRHVMTRVATNFHKHRLQQASPGLYLSHDKLSPITWHLNYIKFYDKSCNTFSQTPTRTRAP